MRRMTFLAIALAALAFTPAHAGITQQQADCAVSVDQASAANPQLVDETNDWNGAVTGNGTGLPDGDIYGAGMDLTNSWISRDANGLHANIQIANLGPAQPNAFFQLDFDYPAADPAQTKHWVEVQLKEYADPVFSYGYLAAGIGGATSYTEVQQGTTTGTITRGANGTITIDIPPSVIDPATTGEWVVNLQAQSMILLGSPEALPDPSPLHHGLLETIDDTTNADTVCDAAL